MKTKEWWLDFLKGTTIGFAIPIPGVSGGTMAVLTGIFDKIANAVSNIRRKFWESVKTLLPIGLGALVMAVIGFVGIKKGFELAPVALSALFAGLILGSTPVVTKELKNAKWDFWSVFRVVASFVFACAIGIASALVYYYSGFSLAAYLTSNTWWIYPLLIIVGFIAATTAVIPGISGSMMMYLMGLYVPLISLFTTWSNWTNPALLPLILGGGVCLGIGCLVGFVTTNMWMKVLLAKKHDSTYQVILGFVFGSLISMFVNPQMIHTDAVTGVNSWIYTDRPIWEWIVGGILFVGAAVLLFLMTKKFAKKADNA